MPALLNKSRALGVLVGHFKSTYEPEEKKSKNKSTHNKHVVKQAQKAQNMVKASMVSSHETGDKNEVKCTDGSTKDDNNRLESTTIHSSILEISILTAQAL